MKILILAIVCVLLPDPAPTIQWSGAHSGIEEPRIELITDYEGLTRAWRITHGGSTDGQPIVNFDRCRLVLALNGADTEVFGVSAVGIGRNRREAVLSLDARGAQSEGEGKPVQTTAWGLFIVPRTPGLILVRENISGTLDGEPEWETIATLGERSDRGDRRPNRQEKPGDHASGTAGEQSLEPDLSLLQPRRMNDRDEDVEGEPYAALFQKGEKELLFIAARHEQDIEHDPTHRLVRMAIEQFNPQVTIIEGLSTSEGPQPERFMTSARRRVESGRASEGMYAAVLADDLGAVVIGGEPDPDATTKVVREAGYSTDDLLGFLLARRIVSMVRNDKIDDDFNERANRALSQLKRRFDIQSDFNAQDFLDWYQEHIGKPFDPRWVKREVSPAKVDDPSILRKIAILVMKAREYNLVELEAKMLREHDRVMVVYGSGHLRWERRLLEKMMGPPAIVTQEHSGVPSPEELEKLHSAWTRKVVEPPRYFTNDGYDEQSMTGVKEGIDATREYVGNYGPTYVFVVGQQTNELEDPAAVDKIAQAFCEVHTANSDRPLKDCLEHEGIELANKAQNGDQEAYLTMAMESDPPTAELIFINTHDWGEDNLPTRGIHEYTHVYQKAFDFTPTWMMEGGAELLACHLGEQNGWGSRREFMEHCARNLERADDLEYTSRDMEDIETAGPEIKKWHRELAYDAGAWAVVYLIDLSSSRSVKSFYLDFYPAVDSIGWEQALCDYTRSESVDSFYEGFDVFMKRPLEERLDVLETLQD
ncbi:MAG: hypothetical protein VX527_12820 [Planctomycetota bacterium]|nr:hypothetical protein [Planctomycetota bacterium]